MEKNIKVLTLALLNFVLVNVFIFRSPAQIDSRTVAAMWLFDEGEGDIAMDFSENGNDGTILGPEWADNGKIGKALKFDGVDDYVDCGSRQALNLTDQITFVAWVRHPKGTEGYIVIRNAPDDSIRQWGFLDYVSQGTISFFCNTGAGREQLDCVGTIDDNTWHHIAVIVSNPNVELFIDGVSEGIRQLNDQIVSINATVWLGKRKPSNFPYTGYLDEVAVFNVALGEDEINRIMNEGLAKAASVMSPVGGLAVTWAAMKVDD